MATKEEIREWLECCGAGGRVNIAYNLYELKSPLAASFSNCSVAVAHLTSESSTPLHLLNESLTGVQGPTFAEWKKAKGREGKVEKIRKAYEGATAMVMNPWIADKILDAIEGEGK